MGALGGRQGCGDTGCTVPPMRRGRGSAFGPRLSLMPGPTGLHIPRLPSGTAASGPHPAPRDPSPQPREAEPVCAPASWPLGTALGTHGPSAQTLSVALSERVGSTGERVRDGGRCREGAPAGGGQTPALGRQPGQSPLHWQEPTVGAGRAGVGQGGGGGPFWNHRQAGSQHAPPASLRPIRPAERRGPPLLPETPQDEDCPAAPCHPGCGHCAR